MTPLDSVSHRRSLGTLAVIGAAAMLGCGADAPTDPGKSAAASAEIAFGYSFDGSGAHARLNLLGADGRVTPLLPDMLNATWGPEWSPDGRTLLYSREVLAAGEPTIWLVQADGSNPRALPGNPSAGGPKWSADGTRVFFLSLGSLGSGIGSVRLDGSDLRWVPLPPDAMIYPAVPALSRDGRRIAFKRPVGEFMTRLWVADLDGSNLRQVSTGSYDGEPRWSPDGSRIVFVRELQSANFRSVLAVVNADGTGEQQITSVTAENSSDHGPIWSPDGQWILYEHWVAPTGGRSHCTILKMPAAGGAPIDLLGDRATGSCHGLAWRTPPAGAP